MLDMSRLTQIRRRAARVAARLREPDRPPAPFVVGVPRSGTTLLRLMLDAHAELAVPPETHFLPRLIRVCRQAEARGEDSRARVLEFLTGHRRGPGFRPGEGEGGGGLPGQGPPPPR